ncbi:PIG-L deacetylase family protein [Williamsia sterculiae]|uniref:N-acetylglucosaminyl deacetylase, LmbE family n=1 Tax=Williamsia sterculiae TaxID=1344003 RepID=A0A1N7G8Z7_9NOCA|nr:PIG-L deacetylase family protein [Williamsia sterculiae]SIS09049.1 N-acetylglucosaminyl deacetylase, LmbE family [Williamsia sterculiae]
MSADARSRLAAASIEGTPEEVWQQWFATPSGQLAELDVMTPRRVVVAGAHPDDEVLGAGGLMAAMAARGVPVTVVCMSDGAGSHPGSPTYTPPELGALRHHELIDAAGVLGVTDVRWTGLPDGGLGQCRGRLVEVLTDVVREGPVTATLLVSVWEHDGHPDHEVVGDASVETADRCGIPLIRYPIWMWHWATPGDPALPVSRLRRLPLSEAHRRAKSSALRRFRTQIAPLSSHPADRVVLPPAVLARHLRTTETVVV